MTLSVNEYKIATNYVQKIEELIQKHKRDVTDFYDEGEQEILYVHIEVGIPPELELYEIELKKIAPISTKI